MNCQEFHQHCYVNPNNQDPQFLSHQQHCLTCAALAQEMRQFELQLMAALKVKVPSGLTERILSQNKTLNDRPWFQQPIASFILLGFILFIIGWQLWPLIGIKPQHIMAYIENEPKALLISGKKSLKPNYRVCLKKLGQN